MTKKNSVFMVIRIKGLTVLYAVREKDTDREVPNRWLVKI